MSNNNNSERIIFYGKIPRHLCRHSISATAGYTQALDSAESKYKQLRGRFHKSREVYSAEIEWLQSLGLRDTVIARCREFLRNSPDDAEIMKTMAVQYQYTSSYDTARAIYREMLAKDLNRNAAIPIAACYIMEGKTDSAIIELQNYTASGGKDPEGFLTLYGLLLSASRIEEIKQMLLTAITRMPGETAFTVLLAKQYMYEGLPDTALSYLEPVRLLFAQHPEIAYISARSYEMKKDTAKAVFHFSRFIRYCLKQSQLLQAQITSTISGKGFMDPDSISKAQRSGNQLDTLNLMLRESFDKLKLLTPDAQYSGILDELISAVPQGALLYIARAAFRQGQGDTAGALGDVETAIRLAPYNELVQRGAGSYYYDTGDFEAAFTAYRAALGKNDKEKLYYERIVELCLRLNKSDEVIEFWKRLYNTNKENRMLRDALLELLHKTNRFEEAEKLLQTE